MARKFRIPEVLSGDPVQTDIAIKAVRYYFRKTSTDGVPAYSGSRFETFGVTESDPNTFGPYDLIAPAMLSTELSGNACVWIMSHLKHELDSLLEQLPSNRDLHTLNREEFEALLGNEPSPGHQLWVHFRHESNTRYLGLGPVRASKLLARKRPRLIPVYDKVVRVATGFPSSRDYWRGFYNELSGNPELVATLEHIRVEAQVPHVSLLRIMDVAVWMTNHRKWPDRKERVMTWDPLSPAVLAAEHVDQELDAPPPDL